MLTPVVKVFGWPSDHDNPGKRRLQVKIISALWGIEELKVKDETAPMVFFVACEPPLGLSALPELLMEVTGLPSVDKGGVGRIESALRTAAKKEFECAHILVHLRTTDPHHDMPC